MGTAREIWESIEHTFGDSSTWDDDKFKKEDPKEQVHECVEHDHNLVIMEDCSTSWSSNDDNDRCTTSSLDKIDGGGDGSFLGYESDVSSSSPTTSHCFMS